MRSDATFKVQANRTSTERLKAASFQVSSLFRKILFMMNVDRDNIMCSQGCQVSSLTMTFDRSHTSEPATLPPLITVGFKNFNSDQV